jgi:hypothetical protein
MTLVVGSPAGRLPRWHRALPLVLRARKEPRTPIDAHRAHRRATGVRVGTVRAQAAEGKARPGVDRVAGVHRRVGRPGRAEADRAPSEPAATRDRTIATARPPAVTSGPKRAALTGDPTVADRATRASPRATRESLHRPVATRASPRATRESLHRPVAIRASPRATRAAGIAPVRVNARPPAEPVATGGSGKTPSGRTDPLGLPSLGRVGGASPAEVRASFATASSTVPTRIPPTSDVGRGQEPTSSSPKSGSRPTTADGVRLSGPRSSVHRPTARSAPPPSCRPTSPMSWLQPPARTGTSFGSGPPSAWPPESAPMSGSATGTPRAF